MISTSGLGKNRLLSWSRNRGSQASLRGQRSKNAQLADLEFSPELFANAHEVFRTGLLEGGGDFLRLCAVEKLFDR